MPHYIIYKYVHLTKYIHTKELIHKHIYGGWDLKKTKALALITTSKPVIFANGFFLIKFFFMN